MNESCTVNHRPSRARASAVALAVIALTASLAGCANVGTDFRRPAIEAPSSWPSMRPRSTNVAEARAPVEERWWEIFNDAQLSRLMGRAIDSNIDVRAATSRLQQSLAMRQDITAAVRPQLAADGAYQRGRNSATGLIDASGQSGLADFNFLTTGLTASWEPDLWGRVRRQAEAADASIELAEYDRRAVLLSVLAETARDYLLLRSAQASLSLARRNQERMRNAFRLSRLRLAEGIDSRLDVARLSSQLEVLESRIPLLEQRQAQWMNALCLLSGEAPGSLGDYAGSEAELPEAPPQFAFGLPSELAERRPDIRRAEARLHAATAAIGVAEGDFYPRIQLSGNLGLQSLQLTDLGSWASRDYAVGPRFSLPIFDGGRLRSVVRLREAQQQEAAWQYQHTVLSAWREVDDAIGLYRARQLAHDRLTESTRQAGTALVAVQRRQSLGAADLIQVLDAQGALFESKQRLIDNATGVSLALVDVYRALGSGWHPTFPERPGNGGAYRVGSSGSGVRRRASA